jgi:thiol-disulfide isomerase/thioredoxin
MQRLRAWRYWPWLRDGALVLLVLLAVRAYQQRDAASGPAPELAAVDIHGTPVSLADYRGQPVLLHFWATWCGVCRAVQPGVDAIASELPVLTVASQSGSASAVAAYTRNHAISAKVIDDARGVLARRFGVRAFPTSFVVDGDGFIRHVEVGYTTELGLRARMWLARR